MASVNEDLLPRPLQYMKGVGPARATLLKRLNLETVRDLVLYFPVSHKDRASVTPIARLKAGGSGESNIVAQIIDVRGRRFRAKEKVEALLQDEQRPDSRRLVEPLRRRQTQAQRLGILLRQSHAVTAENANWPMRSSKS